MGRRGGIRAVTHLGHCVPGQSISSVGATQAKPATSFLTMIRKVLLRRTRSGCSNCARDRQRAQGKSHSSRWSKAERNPRPRPIPTITLFPCHTNPRLAPKRASSTLWVSIGGYKRSGSKGQKLLNRRLERYFAVTVVLPWDPSCQKGGSGFHREALGLKAGAHLAPVQRHRDRRADPHARG